MNHVVAKIPLPPAFGPLKRTFANIDDQLNPFFQVGPKLASAPAIYISTTIHHVTGSAPISYIIPPKDSNAGRLALIADGNWSLLTNGNIGAAVGPVNVGDCINLVYDTEIWYPEAGSAAPSPSFKLTPVNVTSSYTVSPTASGLFLKVTCSVADIPVLLPPALGTGHFIVVKKADLTAYNVVITPSGTDSIDGNTGGVARDISNPLEGLNLIDFAAGDIQLW